MKFYKIEGSNLLRDENGKKLYPVCSWESNQHKLYNAHDRIVCDIYDGKADWDDLDKLERAMDAFEKCVVGGIVYAYYEDSLLIKNYVGGYNARH